MKVVGYIDRLGVHREYRGFLDGIRKCGYDVEISKVKKNIVPIKADYYIFSGYSEKKRGWNKVLDDAYGKVSIFMCFDPHIRSKNWVRNYRGSNPKSYYAISKTSLRSDFKYFKAPPFRWDQLKKDYDIEVKPWRKKGKHIIIAYSIRNPDHPELDIKKMTLDAAIHCASTGREVIVCTRRASIEEEKEFKSISSKFKNIRFVVKVGVANFMDNAHCMISYGGGSGTEAIIAGVPAISLTPNLTNFLIPNNGILKFIDDPPTPDRQRWFNWIAYQQWNIKELDNGLPWRFHMRKRFNKIRKCVL